MSKRDQIVNFLQEEGINFKEKNRTIIDVPCPACGREDKFSFLKENGWNRCYRGSCDYGKKPFLDFVMLTLGLNFSEAKERLADKEDDADLTEGIELKETLIDPFSEDNEEDDSVLMKIDPITYPDWFMKNVQGTEGHAYLLGRGITDEMITKYGFQYSDFHRRVYLPIRFNGKIYGYQGRACQKVDDKDRVRNNEGFRRDSLVMFLDNLIGSDFAIMAEGPFDGLKFEKVGSFIATMGKEITPTQMDLILSYGIKRIYLALDEDAAAEMNKLRADYPQIEFWKLDVPESCIKRCLANGKKIDFGECDYDEAEYAYLNARKIDDMELFSYLKEI